MIRVLVHIEREDRLAAGERRRVVHCPLIEELAVVRRPGEQHPSRPAALRLPHRGKFRAPAIDTAEIAGQRIAQLPFRLALAAQRGEKELAQDHRVRRDQLFALQAIDDKDRRGSEVEFCELRRDGVQPPDRAAIIVLVMAEDQLFGHPLDPRRIAGERLHGIGHRSSSGYSNGVIAIMSKWVTLSALVHSATFPGLAEVLSSVPTSMTVGRATAASREKRARKEIEKQPPSSTSAPLLES
jgi:hypothetical protein